ncbi:hypothetical protein L6452_14319 [Arctium lappa]|uniref:Uncharacterized protein n=1 Tax=Arctium lappa TaxID=4217 RepID=A0ACB9CKQ0_ARCLA|nr:hypothetical protein L6452_14319 [Arctium lappa]
MKLEHRLFPGNQSPSNTEIDSRFCSEIDSMASTSQASLLSRNNLKLVNTVYWYPWGEEAFKQAWQRDVPIFLSNADGNKKHVQVGCVCHNQ